MYMALCLNKKVAIYLCLIKIVKKTSVEKFLYFRSELSFVENRIKREGRFSFSK
jgi:hypothetical protein